MVTKINYVEKVVNNITRSYAAYIPLSNNPKYLPNMAVSVKIATYQNARAFVLPQRVIQKTDNGNFVFVVDEKMKAKLKPVQLGMTYEGNVEILSGLNLPTGLALPPPSHFFLISRMPFRTSFSKNC